MGCVPVLTCRPIRRTVPAGAVVVILAALLTVVAGSIGCDREPSASESSTQPQAAAGNGSAAPATASAGAPATDSALPARAAATGPAIIPGGDSAPATAPSGSFMMIEQQRVDFPAARLRVQVADGKVTALLFSDDPRDAINDSYTGNSFYFEMPLPDASEPSDFVNSTWHFTAPSAGEREDSPYGVFLDGHRRQLQPLEVKVDFDPVDSGLGASASPASHTTVWISGKFQLVNVQDAGEPPRPVSLAARLIAKTVVK